MRRTGKAPKPNMRMEPGPADLVVELRSPLPRFTPVTDSFRVEIVTDLKRLELLRDRWKQLAESALEENVFYEPFLALPALRHLCTDQKWKFALTYAKQGNGDETLCGLFPLVVKNSFHGLPVKAIELWRHPHCFFCTPLVHRDCAFEVVGAFLDWLEKDSAGRLMKFATISADGPFYQALISHIRTRSLPNWVSVSYVRALMKPASSAKEYLQRAISTRRMKEYRRQGRRLSEVGELTFDALRGSADLQVWLEEFLNIEGSGWKGGKGSALKSKDTYQAFFEEATRAASAEGRLEMLALRLDGKAIAQKCNFLTEVGAFGFKIGFDEEFRRYSPGVLLEIECIRRFHEQRRVQWIDSCADPDHPMIDHLWTERRLIQSVVIGIGPRAGGLLIALAPLLRWMKRLVVLKKPIHK